jgi:spore cortex protein
MRSAVIFFRVNKTILITNSNSEDKSQRSGRMKYAVITSGIMALFIAGCATNDNGQGRNNIARDTSNVNQRADHNLRNVNNRNNNGIIQDDRKPSNRQDDISSADDAANRVAGLKEVKHAAVILTDNNAYVGATLNEGTKLTKNLERKIANTVRKSDTKAENVYVSTNPDFMNRMDGYVNDLRNGRPISGLADEFGQTIRRVFPNAR